MTPLVDIVIVSFNTREDLSRCLSSLFQRRSPVMGRVMVVDNASTDGSQAHVADAWPSVELYALPDNVGFAAANNVAIRASTADYVLLLNSDTEADGADLERLVERLEATGAVAAGPLLHDANGRPEVSHGPMITPLGELRQMLLVKLAAGRGVIGRFVIDRLTRRERFVDWVSGGCLLVRRDEAVAAGLLDERYFLYEEDVDFCAALRARGGVILYSPRARVLHRRGTSVRQSRLPSTLHYDRSHLAFYQKHHPGWEPLLRLWMRARGRNVR